MRYYKKKREGGRENREGRGLMIKLRKRKGRLKRKKKQRS
jgi:hypothetical protein